jgi:hypothetical protein
VTNPHWTLTRQRHDYKRRIMVVSRTAAGRRDVS